MHALLSDAPSLGLYVPAGHCSKVILKDNAPTAAQKPPFSQAEHDVDAATELYVPTPQAVHSPAPGRALNVPGAQREQRMLFVKGETVPGIQIVQLEATSYCAQPTWHGVQA